MHVQELCSSASLAGYYYSRQRGSVRGAARIPRQTGLGGLRPPGAAVKENGINSAGKAHKKKIKGRERLGLTLSSARLPVPAQECFLTAAAAGVPCAIHEDPMGEPQDKTRGR